MSNISRRRKRLNPNLSHALAHPVHHGDHVHRLSVLWNLSGTLPSLSNPLAQSTYGSSSPTSTLYSPLSPAATRLPAVYLPASQGPQSTARSAHRSRHPHHNPANRVQTSPEIDRVAIEDGRVRVHRASSTAEIGARGGCMYVPFRPDPTLQMLLLCH